MPTRKFNNPLDNVRIASPCPADWNTMYGDERKRFCHECKLNVYNLSDMTKPEAESFLLQTQGRVCVRYYRRRDGSVLTRDCPVGWQAFKRRAARTATATLSLLISFVTGLVTYRVAETFVSLIPTGDVPPPKIEMKVYPRPTVVGELDLNEIETWVVGQKSAITKTHR